MAVSVEPDPSIVLGTPRELFRADEKGLVLRPRAYDATPDGKGFIVVKRLEEDQDRDNIIIVIANWFAEFAEPP